MRKRLFALMLAVILAVLMTGCGNGSSEPAEVTEEPAVTEEVTEENTAEPSNPITNGAVPDNTRYSDGFNEVRKGRLLFKVPNYYGILPDQNWDDVINSEVTSLYAARGENLCMIELFDIENTGAILEEHFIEYHDQLLEKKITSIEGSDVVSDFTRDGYTVFHTDNGLVAAVGSYSFSMSDIRVNAKTVMINNPDAPALIYVSLFQAEGAEYDYTVEFEKMIMGAEVE